jgi:hypothetical protein
VAGSIHQVIGKRPASRRRRESPSAARAADRYRSDVCTGVRAAGGSLLAGGHVVIGTVDGADSGDLGHTLDVRLPGATADTTSLRVPINPDRNRARAHGVRAPDWC